MQLKQKSLSNSSLYQPTNKFITGQTERVIYARERQEGMYGALPFYFGKVLAQCPFEIVYTAVFWSICYWMSGLNPLIERYFISLGVLLFITYCSQWFGYLFAVAIPQLPTANMCANIVWTVFVLTSAWTVSSLHLKLSFSCIIFC
jgi:hypothetical protein